MRHWTIVGLIVVLAGLFGASGEALAQSANQPVPPDYYSLDARGVDLVRATFNYSATEVQIGQPGAGGIAQVRGNFGNQWRDALLGSLAISGTAYTVSIGLESNIFTLTGGAFVPKTNDGSTLTQSGAVFTYTTGTGTVAKFSTAYAATATGQPSTTQAMLYESTEPNGDVTNYNYRSQTYCRTIGPDGCSLYGTVHRLQSVTNNHGYQMLYKYQSDNVLTLSGASLNDRVGRWLRIISATGINNAVDYCAPDATSCTFTQTWPGATYGTDASGNETVTDELGRVTTYYTGSSWKVRFPGSTVDDIVYTVTGTGTTFSVADATGVWNYSYTDFGAGRIMNVTGPLNQAMTVVSNLVTSRVTTVEQTTSVSPTVTRVSAYWYDSEGRMTRASKPEGDYTQYAYDGRGNVTTVTQVSKLGSGPSNIVTSATYAATCSNPVACNRPTSTTDARGYRTDYVWNATHGGLESVTAPTPNGATPIGSGTRPETRIAYAAQTAYYKNSSGVIVAAPSSVMLPVSSSACANNAFPGCVGTTDESKTTLVYGSTGVANNLLPTSVTRGDGSGALSVTTAMTYDPNGDVLTIDGPLSGAGDATRYRYDTARQLIGGVGPDPDGAGALLNRAQRMTYNARGRVTLTEVGTTPGYSDADWSSFSVLQKQATEYDSWGRLVVARSQDAAGNTLALQQVSYDAAGRPDCSITRMNPGAFGSFPTTSACSLGATGGYGPDRIIQATYDAAGRPISTVGGVGTGSTITESVAYSPNDKPVSMTDGAGNVSTFAYDSFDRLFRQCYPGAATCASATPTVYEEYGYDAASNVTSFRNRAGEVISASYDNLNRRVTLGGSAIADRTFSYDNLNRPITTAFTGGGPSSTNAWDALSRLTSQAQSPIGTVSYTYDAIGRRLAMYWPDGVYATYEYNVLDPTGIRENGSGLLIAYAHDNLGRLIQSYRGNGVWSNYGYDGISRLASLNNDPSGTAQDVAWTYTYNPAGQIVSRSVSNNAYVYTPASTAVTYVNNMLNRVTSINGSAVGYDGRGNITSAPGATYGYNAENQMTSASTSFGGSGYAYDPSGRLYQANDGANRRFLYDGQQVIAEYDASGVIQNRYVPGLGLDDVVTSYDAGGARIWLLSDERGSVVGLTNGSGASTAINTYDEYGVPAASNAGRFQYTGQMWLPDAQAYHYRARAYAPQIGRFMQPDPLGYGAGMNIYGYVGGDPVNLTDMMGLQSDEVEDVVVTGRRRRPQNPCGLFCYLKRGVSAARNFFTRGDEADNPTCPVQGFAPSPGFLAPPAAAAAGEAAGAAGGAGGAAGGSAFLGPLAGVGLAMIPSSTAPPWQDEAPGSWTQIGRYWGGGARDFGRSWGPANMPSDPNPRNTWGIPNVNTMENFSRGWIRTSDLNNPSLVNQKPADELDGYDGGGPEYHFLADPKTLIRGVVTENMCK